MITIPAITDVTLTNNANLKQFLFRCVSPLKNKKTQPSIDIPMVNTSASNRILFRFTGQQQDVSFNFALFDDGVDVSNGTHSSTVKTVSEQIQYLMDEIFTHDFDTTWKLENTVNFGASGITGAIDNIEVDNPQGAGKLIVGTFAFKRGRLGTLKGV